VHADKKLSRHAVMLLGLGAVLFTLGQACGGEDQRPAEWAYIQPVLLAPNCATASCHSKGAAVSGLDFSESDVAYRSLVELSTEHRLAPNDAPGVSSRPMVTPCNPTQSRIVNMLRARGAQRMPPDRPLAEADIALIERWILAGARKSTGDADPCAVAATGGGNLGTAGMGGS
jgi:hypothetical protein